MNHNYTQEQLARIYGGYIGSEHIVNFGTDYQTVEYLQIVGEESLIFHNTRCKLSEAKLLLTPLDKITEEDRIECYESIGVIPRVEHFNMTQPVLPFKAVLDSYNFLKSKGYDVDGLIASGIAIDRTKLDK